MALWPVENCPRRCENGFCLLLWLLITFEHADILCSKQFISSKHRMLLTFSASNILCFLHVRGLTEAFMNAASLYLSTLTCPNLPFFWTAPRNFQLGLGEHFLFQTFSVFVNILQKIHVRNFKHVRIDSNPDTLSFSLEQLVFSEKHVWNILRLKPWHLVIFFWTATCSFALGKHCLLNSEILGIVCHKRV